MVYYGWHEDWFDDFGNPKVSEEFIYKFVNRYFVHPEDCNSDEDVPLAMVWARCVVCGGTIEHFVNDTSRSSEYLLYNEDGTF